MRDKVELSFTDKLGRIVLIAIVINSLKLSLCNIYAPNNQTEQLEFLQQLNNLEKRNYIKKTITELGMDDETIIKNETQILDAIENII